MIESVIPVHSNFTVWVLANRAGKLFHGNRFEIMDCFSTHVVPNPDLESEIKLLQSYAPNVDVSLIRRLSASFDELRNHFEHGEVTYPYSTREAVAVAKHLEKYPHDDIVKVLHNVLDMDSFSEHLYSTLGEVFRGHGFPFQAYEARMKAAGSGSPLRLEYTKEATTGSIPPPLSSPKIGTLVVQFCDDLPCGCYSGL